MGPSGERGEVHELLPWYVAGTLDREESAAFRAHLQGCVDCRRELDLVEELRLQLERHGRDWIEEHPSAERLVAAARGEAGDEEAAFVRRHLALCATCALETRWVLGEGDDAVEREEPAVGGTRDRRLWYWIPVMAAAAGVVLGLLLPVPRPLPDDEAAILVPTFVEASLRTTARVTRVEIEPGQKSVVLLFELDFPPQSFPLALELLDEGGGVVQRLDRITIDRLLNGAHLFLTLPLRIAPPGRYTARITSAGGAEAPLVLPFEIAPAPTP